MNLEEFQCRLCGNTDSPKKKDAYWYCQGCGVIFWDPKLFTKIVKRRVVRKENKKNLKEFLKNLGN